MTCGAASGEDSTARDAVQVTPVTSDLLLVAGEGKLITVELPERPLMIGRGSDCDVVIEHRALSRRHAIVSVKHLALARRAALTPQAAPARLAPAATLEGLSDQQRADRDRVVRALAECGGNQSRAAKQLGISRTTLVTKLALYRIPRPHA
jgi:hypothetical protein